MKGATVIEQSLHLNKSESSIHKMIKRLKVKYDNVQPYSKILPPRKFSAEETYMDTH